jgi:hypothetical protein
VQTNIAEYISPIIILFQLRKSDMCKVCDKLIIKINEADTEGRENEGEKLKERHMLHLDEAMEMQDSLKVEIAQARANLNWG